MGSKFYDIPFRLRTAESDFICKDGELYSVTGLTLRGADGNIYTSPLGGNEDSNILGWNQGGVSLPPAPDIDFAIVRDTLKGWHLMADDFPAKSLVASTASMEYWNQLAAKLLRQFKSEAEAQHLFVAPFYVMAVWKTVDGTYLSPTTPEMIIPNSGVPVVATFDDPSDSEIEFKVAAALGNLYFKMRAPEVLRDWVGKIASLEIMVSPGLYDYDTFDILIPSRKVTSSNYCRSLDLSTGVIANRQICTVTLPLAWTTSAYNKGGNLAQSNQPTYFYPFVSIPLSEIDIMNEWGSTLNRGSLSSDVFAGEKISYASLTSADSATKGVASTLTLQGNDGDFSFQTRPIKLSGGGELKRMRRVFLRGSFTPESITLKVYGSRDMLDWHLISQCTGRSVTLLPRSYFRFYRIGIEGYLSSAHTLEGIGIED